jgi:hypothetical protein
MKGCNACFQKKHFLQLFSLHKIYIKSLSFVLIRRHAIADAALGQHVTWLRQI